MRDKKGTDNNLRDGKGRFLPGHSASQLQRVTPIGKCIREATRDEALKCAHSLVSSVESFQFEQKNPNRSRLQDLTNEAYKNRNYKFIEYLLNRALGKIPDAKEDKRSKKIDSYDAQLQEDLVKMSLEARRKIEEQEREKTA